MLIESLYCSCIEGEVPTDHYAPEPGSKTEVCIAPPMPLPWLLAMISINKSDDIHSGNRMSATRMQSCPRKIAIEDNIPARRVNMKQFNSMTWGTAIHEFMQKHTPPGFYQEIELPPKGSPPVMLFQGTEAEIAVRGRLDILTPDTILLEDYKCTSESSQKFRFNRRAADPEWRAQASIYKILGKRSIADIDIKQAAIWSGAMTSARCPAPPWFKIPLAWMGEEEILMMKPHGAEFSVADNIIQFKHFLKMKAELDLTFRTRKHDCEDRLVIDTGPEYKKALYDLIATMPLAGRGAWRGEMCKKYCGSARTCNEMEGLVVL